ncbi:hypothetical protein L202_06420 [Cryptococcus amylolentus CBS 6039]|uniref:Protein CPL1-like domain-containing protein n=1 Tax=Cryptococcus amylolentus CBS 6039 TaxID=1295533 RepID=A0A1E3HFX8_9TREE|nr:hypothetical protein L202_06420 [Cryptococcus amylolentus CBS 6039]ODN75224.1 hypothetical protein L202_06420 [Cryptococcus amylolentus CBS 6039]
MLALHTLPLLLVVCLSSISFVVAESPFLGCINQIFTTVSSQSSQRSAAACITECASNTYALYVTKGFFNYPTNNCLCTSADIDPIDYDYFTTTTCTAGSEAAVYRTSSSFTFKGCSSGTGIISSTSGTVASPDACLTKCAAYANAFYTPNIFGSGYTCACGSGTLTTSSDRCTTSNYYTFSHTAVATASGLAKKKRGFEKQERMRRSQVIRERGWDCPRGMKACNVMGVSDAWECVDPEADLESCGGCAHGDYVKGANSTAATGVNCSSLPGLLRGSVTCSSGSCQAFACKSGWTLHNGACSRSLTVQL